MPVRVNHLGHPRYDASKDLYRAYRPSHRMGHIVMQQKQQPSAFEQVCVICNYDLRADPQAVCPECGTSFAERERITQGRSATATRAKQAVAWTFGIIVLVPWLVILAVLSSLLLIDWFS